MKAFVTSIGEPTTELCVWALERNGFDVVLLQDDSTLWNKLKQIYERADDDFLRVDADIIVNRNCRPDIMEQIIAVDYLQHAWWVQFMTYDWFKQGSTHGGVQFIRKEALPALRGNVDKFRKLDRPETLLSRITEFYNPRRFETYDMLVGLHGYGIKNVQRVKNVKANRGQYDSYDWELAERLAEL